MTDVKWAPSLQERTGLAERRSAWIVARAGLSVSYRPNLVLPVPNRTLSHEAASTTRPPYAILAGSQLGKREELRGNKVLMESGRESGPHVVGKAPVEDLDSAVIAESIVRILP